MSHLLDTNVCIHFLNPGHDELTQRICATAADIFLCSVVKAELYFGAYHSERREKNLALLQRFFQQFHSLAFDDRASELCGRSRAELRGKGTPIGPYDLQIASIALAHDLVLVTHSVAEFSRVSGLRIEDWEANR